MIHRIACALAFTLAACGGSGEIPDAASGRPDAAPTIDASGSGSGADAAVPDAAGPESAVPDIDAAVPDGAGGGGSDAARPDAPVTGSPDASLADAAVVDGPGGGGPDAGGTADAATPDAGGGGGTVDAGAPDSSGGGGAGDVTLTFFPHPPAIGTPAANGPFVAGQDGDGAWQVLSGTNGAYKLHSATGRYALAFACTGDPLGIQLSIIYATIAEATSVRGGCEAPTVHISGQVSGLDFTQLAQLIFLGDSAFAQGVGSLDYTDVFVDHGSHDAVGISESFGGQDLVVDKLIVKRGIDASADTTVDFDFANEGFAPATFSASIDGALLAGESATITSSFFSQHGVSAVLNGTQATSGTLPVVPLAQLGASEVSSVQATAGAATPDTTTVRLVAKYFRTPASQTLTLPPALAAPTVTLAATLPYPRISYTVVPPAGEPGVSMGVASGSGTSTRQVVVFHTPGRVSAGTFSFTVPDLSGLAGFDAGWMPSGSMDWIISASFANRSLGELFRAPGEAPTAALDGLILSTSGQSGTLTP